MPRPESYRTLLAGYASLQAAGDAVSQIIAAGLLPGAMEIMDRLAIAAAEAAVDAGYPPGAAAILLVELEGEAIEVDAEFDAADDADHGVGRDQHAHRQRRRRTARASGRGASAPSPPSDASAPTSSCRTAWCRARGSARPSPRSRSSPPTHGLRVANVFHAGDGNLHPLILFDGREAGALERAEPLAADILRLCIRLGGSITGEHGVGLEKRAFLRGDVRRRRCRVHAAAAPVDRSRRARQPRQDARRAGDARDRSRPSSARTRRRDLTRMTVTPTTIAELQDCIARTRRRRRCAAPSTKAAACDRRDDRAIWLRLRRHSSITRPTNASSPRVPARRSATSTPRWPHTDSTCRSIRRSSTRAPRLAEPSRPGLSGSGRYRYGGVRDFLIGARDRRRRGPADSQRRQGRQERRRIPAPPRVVGSGGRFGVADGGHVQSVSRARGARDAESPMRRRGRRDASRPRPSSPAASRSRRSTPTPAARSGSASPGRARHDDGAPGRAVQRALADACGATASIVHLDEGDGARSVGRSTPSSRWAPRDCASREGPGDASARCPYRRLAPRSGADSIHRRRQLAWVAMGGRSRSALAAADDTRRARHRACAARRPGGVSACRPPTTSRSACAACSIPGTGSVQHQHPLMSSGRTAAAMAQAISSCVHCGFCLPACPTYRVLGEEMDSPRGRILLMKQALEGTLRDRRGAAVRRPLPWLSGCETACPSGVRYRDLVVPFRAQARMQRAAKARRDGFDRRCWRRIESPARFRLAAAAGPNGAGTAAMRSPSRCERWSRCSHRHCRPRARCPPSFRPSARAAPAWRCWPDACSASCGRRSTPRRAACWPPTASRSSIPPDQGCCGALALHAGLDDRGARAGRAETARSSLRDVDAIVTNAAGCGSAMKDHAALAVADARRVRVSRRPRSCHATGTRSREPSSRTRTRVISATDRAFARRRDGCCSRCRASRWSICRIAICAAGRRGFTTSSSRSPRRRSAGEGRRRARDRGRDCRHRQHRLPHAARAAPRRGHSGHRRPAHDRARSIRPLAVPTLESSMRGAVMSWPLHQGVRMIPISSRRPVGLVVLAASVLASSSFTAAEGQLPLLRDNALVYAHHHLNATSIADAKKFWVDALGGTPAKAGPLEMVKFPNVIIVFTQRAPTGGSKGTTVNHVGFYVPSAQGHGRQGPRRRLSDHHAGGVPGDRAGQRRRRVHRGHEGHGRVHDGPRQHEGRVRRESRLRRSRSPIITCTSRPTRSRR